MSRPTLDPTQVIDEAARLADADAAAKGTPVACDVGVVYARKP